MLCSCGCGILFSNNYVSRDEITMDQLFHLEFPQGVFKNSLDSSKIIYHIPINLTPQVIGSFLGCFGYIYKKEKDSSSRHHEEINFFLFKTPSFGYPEKIL